MKTERQILVWNEELFTGVAQIDDQHHMLVNMLGEAKRCLTDENRPDRLVDLVHDLMSYALYHFETEEELMLKNHYDPQLRDEHVQEHRTFSAKMAGLWQELNQGKPISSAELLGFLSDWLHNHILNTDKQLGQFLAETSR